MQFRFVKVAAPVSYTFTEPQGGCKNQVMKSCKVLLGTPCSQSWPGAEWNSHMHADNRRLSKRHMWDCITFAKSVTFWDFSFSSYQKMQVSVPSSSKIHWIYATGMSVPGIFISNKMQGGWYGNYIFKDLPPDSAHLHVDLLPHGDKLPDHMSTVPSCKIS